MYGNFQYEKSVWILFYQFFFFFFFWFVYHFFVFLNIFFRIYALIEPCTSNNVLI